MIMENMDVDLSIVKKERMELEDYGNILDNFNTEHDYNDFHTSNSLSCTEGEDVNVDWLTNFFDEPTHDNMSGLNPPLSDISDSGPTSVSRMTSISSDILLDSYTTFSDNYENTMPDLGSDEDSLDQLSCAPKISPTICSTNNPFLSQTRSTKDIILSSLKNESASIKVEDSSHKLSTNDVMQVDSLTTAPMTSFTQTTTTQANKLENKPAQQQKLLLFMNTPENRAKLAGTNFNIINANLLSKISGQSDNVNHINNIKQTMNLINLKKCIRLNSNIKNEDNSKCLEDNVSASTVNTTLQSIMAANQQKEKKILPIDLLNGHTIIGHTYGLSRKERDQQESDSGYESPTSSSGSSPCSPPIELSERKDICHETIQYIDVPPHERQPFYLSEEEKRTLIMEGLPIPQGLPLNKSEERALKKVRRKIKNKISAQESRRKKKEYMESLEKKVDCYASENNILKKKVGSLEVANRSLIIQVQKLQALVASKISPSSNNNNNNTCTILETKQEIIDVEQ